MDHLESLQLFTRIVEVRSFGRAADMQNIPRPTATYAIKQLEKRLGTRLLERTTRLVRPTLDGQAFYERCVPLLSELEDAEAALRQVAANPRGLLRVDMSSTHAQRLVLPRIDEFHQRFPNIALHVSSGDRLVDLVREGVDCVIRAGPSRDSALVARRLAMMPQVVCASPAYLERFGTPQRPADLAAHHTIGFASRSGEADHSVELQVEDEWRSYIAGGWMSVNDSESYVVSAKRGCGLIQLPRFHIEQELRDGHLVEVLAPWSSPAMQLSALYPYRRQLSPRVRVFIDWLLEVYQQHFGELPADH